MVTAHLQGCAEPLPAAGACGRTKGGGTRGIASPIRAASSPCLLPLIRAATIASSSHTHVAAPYLAAPTAKARVVARRPEPCRLQGDRKGNVVDWKGGRPAGVAAEAGPGQGCDPPPLQQPASGQQPGSHGDDASFGLRCPKERLTAPCIGWPAGRSENCETVRCSHFQIVSLSLQDHRRAVQAHRPTVPRLRLDCCRAAFGSDLRCSDQVLRRFSMRWSRAGKDRHQAAVARSLPPLPPTPSLPPAAGAREPAGRMPSFCFSHPHVTAGC